MSYRDALPPLPTTFDRHAAIDYHATLLELLGRGGWTRNETRSLQRLERRWKRRALGRDPRWLLAGDRGGRLPRETEAVLADAAGSLARKPHPDWSDEP